MKVFSRFVSVCMVFALLFSVIIAMPPQVSAQITEIPDVDQVSASWPVVFEDAFTSPTAKWDAPSGSYMNYEYLSGRFVAKDTNASSKARIKGRNWSQFLLTFNLVIPDISTAGAFMRVDLGDSQSSNYDSLLVKSNKISFYKSGIVGETKLADYTMEPGVSYDFKILVDGSSVIVQMKKNEQTVYQTIGMYTNLFAAEKRTVTFGHNLLKPSLDNVKVYSPEAEFPQIPDVDQLTASWPAVFEDTFATATAKWDAAPGNYMNYQYVDGRFVAKDANSVSKARIKGKSWSKFLLTFNLVIPDVSTAGSFMRVDLGDSQSSNYDSLLVKSNKISFFKSGIVGETKLADYIIESGVGYDFRLLVDGNSVIVQIKKKDETAYQTMGKYTGLFTATKRTVTFGHNLLKPSLDDVRVFASAADNPYTGPILNSLQFYKTTMNLRVGDTENLRVIYEPKNVELEDDSVIWSSSNEQIVKLTGSASKARAVTAVSPGSAVIQAVTANNSIIVTCQVTVTPAAALSYSTASFAVYGAKQAIPSALYGMNDPKLNDLGRSDQWYSARNITLMKDLGIDLLRVPDGTAANYYLYKDGSLVNANDPRYANVTTGFEYTSVNGKNNGKNGIYLNDIFKSPNELNLPSTFVLNVAYQSVEDIIDEVQQIRSLSQQPIRIEMGNEFYLNHYGNAFPSVTNYVYKARQVYTAIKHIDPTIKVGIVILDKWQETIIVGNPDAHKPNDPLDLVDTAHNRYVRWEEWNRTIAANPDCYDAVIPHEYTGIHDLDNLTQEKFMDFLAVNNENRYQLIKAQSEQFPNKEIWITEYGGISGLIFGGETNLTEKGRIHLGKTPAFAMHYMERFLNFIKTGKVQISAYHCLIDNQFFGVVQDRFDANNKAGMVVLPPYYTFREIGKLLKENEYYYDMNMTTGDYRMMNNVMPADYIYGKDLKVNDVGAWGLGDENGVKTVVFSNRTNKEIEVSLPGEQMMPIWSYGGDPVPDFLVNDYTIWRQEPKSNPYPTIPVDPFSTTTTLKPYTMTVVKLHGKTYDDVKANYWAQSVINTVASKGIVAGGTTSLYLPDAIVTKADFTVMLAKALQIPNDYSDTPTVFTDMSAAGYVDYPAIVAAAGKGIVERDQAGNFNPNQTLTKQQLVAMTQKAAAILGKNADILTTYSSFSDPSSNSDDATRAEAAKIVYVLLGL
ncbi:S-layer homology domain-containing protein [Paenibacillus sp. WQ 127069]|uniref:S-layer homology domain-containing protein n=1 Tax=Paenibacillus baimaensis TaxID=2982185 RepID=A0ABT2UHR2_9BACL|nr:S-layer homology domain-containing protein [Paenibacillus sp. WQ 127069]MCU6794183.1 S-layer homology domain-containing protein [Paenibacillus sp. WQ 127069]